MKNNSSIFESLFKTIGSQLQEFQLFWDLYLASYYCMMDMCVQIWKVVLNIKIEINMFLLDDCFSILTAKNEFQIHNKEKKNV